PTGSMAPTLMGRHKDVRCPICEYPFQVNASEEVDRDGRPRLLGDRVGSCICPMCRYTMAINDQNPQPSYSGDRIIVNKFSYQFEDPKRWDVIVFYYPEEAHDNFIKRLVGLPRETVRIRFGDIWIRNENDNSPEPDDRQEFRIARKPPEKLLAMFQPVFDNEYMPAIARYGWPVRWQTDPVSSDPAGAWTSEKYTVFQTDGTSSGEVWLRYHHLVPSFGQWTNVKQTGKPSEDQINPQLITDFAPYNTNRNRLTSETRPYPTPDILGLHWVGDLAVSATVELENAVGQVVLELVKGGQQFQCRLDVATGQATLSISGDDMQNFHPTAETKFRGPDKYDLIFSNCDRQILLWVDGEVVKFDAPTEYDDLHNTRPTSLDLAPVGIASQGVKMKVSRLKIYRDIYYIAGNKTVDFLDDYIRLPSLLTMGGFAQFLSDPKQWSAFDESNMRKVDFTLKDDQYFALGDNSAKSRDSRLWNKQHWINRELLKGKALFIYWPHSWNRIPYLNIPFPFFPNFSSMHFIE
ncbi:MAG TPA: signal peptidase I, partial [Thermoguttaceae bacterium]